GILACAGDQLLQRCVRLGERALQEEHRHLVWAGGGAEGDVAQAGVQFVDCRCAQLVDALGFLESADFGFEDFAAVERGDQRAPVLESTRRQATCHAADIENVVAVAREVMLDYSATTGAEWQAI